MRYIICTLILLSFLSEAVAQSSKNDWLGIYTYGSTDPVYLKGLDDKIDSSINFCHYGELEIYLEDNNLSCVLDICNASYHVGNVSGYLNILSDSTAEMRFKNSGNYDDRCYLDLSLKRNNDLQIKEISCSAWHGHRASFEGSYSRTSNHVQSKIYLEDKLSEKSKRFFEHFNKREFSELISMTNGSCKIINITSDIEKNVNVMSTSRLEEFKPMFEQNKMKYREEISAVNTQANNAFASTWMDYKFFINDKLEYCGTNRIDWINTQLGWKIYEITDNKQVNACEDYSTGEILGIDSGEKALTVTINKIMDRWHQAAAEADEDIFFGLMAESCIYLGTDKTERWTKASFMNFALPHFQKESAWAFTANWRNIYFTDNHKYAWFEESLKTWMGECRGSGVLKFENGVWLIHHYNLSVTIDNDKIKSFIKLTETD